MVLGPDSPFAVTEVQFLAHDPDASCGDDCDPQSCSDSEPPVCVPAHYNPADPRCNPAFGGGALCGDLIPAGQYDCASCEGLSDDDANPCCQGLDSPELTLPAAAGHVCTLAAISLNGNKAAGSFISPVDEVTPVGPVIAVNLEDVYLDGTGVTISGLDLRYRCDTNLGGTVLLNLDCTDGDDDCAQNQRLEIICPFGPNWCSSDGGADCSASNDCLTDGTCDGSCDPLCDPDSPAYDPQYCQGFECDPCPGKDLPLPARTPCDSNGVGFCDGLGHCIACSAPGDCLCEQESDCAAAFPPDPCYQPSACFEGSCQPPVLNGSCSGDPQRRTIALGCTNDIVSDTSILSWDLVAAPGPVLGGQPVQIAYSGELVLPESFLDSVLGLVAGFDQAALVAAGATVLPRDGLLDNGNTHASLGIELPMEPLPTTCNGGAEAGNPCDSDMDCPPLGVFACQQIVDVPTIDGTGDACAVCNGLGPPKDAQCADNGYCIAPGGLKIPLGEATGSYRAEVSGLVLLGWDDQHTGSSVQADGTYLLPAASFAAPWQPNGIRAILGPIQIAMQCTMAVDSNGPVGVGVPDGASPTPDSHLLSIGIQVP